MSRVDEEREAQRLQERLLQEKQLKEAKAKTLQQQESAFSKLVQGSKLQQQQQVKQQGFAKAVLARAQQDVEAGLLQADAARTERVGKAELDQHAGQREASAHEESRVLEAHAGEAQQQGSAHEAGSQAGFASARMRAEDHGDAKGTSASRDADAKATQESTDERGAAHLKGGAQAGRGKGDLRADRDGSQGKGQQGGGGSGKNDGGGGEVAPSFRFNPALMAPVPVAKPRTTMGSDRLRQVANEIAQKIVERARVGTTAAGAAEFQIDLRSNVLSGLSIKLSSKQGRIKAVFSGSDREVLKLLEEHRERIKNALTERGLFVEELRVEAKG